MQIEPFCRCCCCSSELRGGGHIALEGSVVDLGAVVVKVWHHWLVHGTVPLHEPWVSVSVSVHVLVVLVEHWVLASSPLAVCVWDWWVLWKHTGESPVHQVWVVRQSLGVELMVPEHQRSVVHETTTASLDDVIDNPGIGDTASGVEVLDWELTDGQEPEKNSELGLGGVVSEVEIRLVGWSLHFSHLTFWEPTLDLS